MGFNGHKVLALPFFLGFREEMEVEHVGELVEEDKGGNKEDKNEKKAAARNTIFKKMLLLITTNPSHESGKDSKENHSTDTTGKIESFEKEVREEKRE